MTTGMRLLHGGEAFLGVVADPEELRLVLEVVLQHDADVRDRSRCPCSAISFRTSSVAKLPCSICVQPARTAALIDSGLCAWTSVRRPERVGLAAGRLQLLVGHRLLAAVADAGGGEELDHVGAGGLRIAHRLTELIGRRQAVRIAAPAGPLVDLADRRQDARPGQIVLRERGAELEVARFAETLHGREAAVTVTRAFSTPALSRSSGVSPVLSKRPSLPKCHPMWTWVSMNPGSRVYFDRS